MFDKKIARRLRRKAHNEEIVKGYKALIAEQEAFARAYPEEGWARERVLRTQGALARFIEEAEREEREEEARQARLNALGQG